MQPEEEMVVRFRYVCLELLLRGMHVSGTFCAECFYEKRMHASRGKPFKGVLPGGNVSAGGVYVRLYERFMEVHASEEKRGLQ